MYNIQWITSFVIIICIGIRFVVPKDSPPKFNLVYNNTLPDAIQFNVRLDQNRYRIDVIKCGRFMYLAEAGSEDQTALITGLTACKLYECTFDITNVYTYEKYVYVKNITTGIRYSTPPIKLLKIISEPTSIRFEMEFEEIDCIDSVDISRDNSKVGENSKVSFWTKYNLTKSLIISELSPCIKYQIILYFNYQSLTYPPLLNDYVRTSPPKLGRITKIEFNPKTNLLTWPSVLSSDCQLTYVITIISETNDETLFFETELNEYDLNFLRGCSNYVIHIKLKGYELFRSIRIVTGYKSSQSTVENVKMDMFNISALSIKWTRPTENPLCDLEYAVQINGVWTITKLLEYVVRVQKNSEYFNISICIAALSSADNCVNYDFDAKLNKSVKSLKQSAAPVPFPPLYRLKSWATITMYETSDKKAVLRIINKISSLPNINFTLVISELKCGNNLVQSFKLYDANNINEKNTLVPDDCTKICEFSEIPNEIELSVDEEVLFSCASTDHNYITLKRGMAYAIMARIFSSTGYTDTMPIEFPNDRVLIEKSNLILYICILVGCIGLLLILVAIVFCCKCWGKNADPTFVEVQYFCAFYRQIDKDFIQREYHSIDEMDFSQLTTTVPENEMQGKNRHTDIIPYDFNRVVLGMGYINASYIDGFKQEKRYIATQGPTKETISDFWLMVVEHQCEGIVMLTDLKENGTVQCYKYYPEISEILVVKDITISNVEEINYGSFIKRILHISRFKIKRYLVHYQFVAWSNGDCPEDAFDLIEFVENTGGQTCESSNPILVHSSLGIGRTGTFIALDILFLQLHEEKYISVCDTVKRLRSQRCRMVETLGQYGFLYDCINRYYLTRIQKRKSGSVQSCTL